MLLQKRHSANDSLHFSLGSTVCSAQGRGCACSGKAALFLSDSPECSSGWPILGWPPPQPLPASSAPAACHACEDAQQAPSGHSLRGERPKCCSKLEGFVACLGGGYQLQGKQKMHQFHVDSGHKMNFPTLSLEE